MVLPSTTCVRKAWLVLGSLNVQLENPAAGYFCESLDLGFPTERAVVTNRPDTDGAVDRTRLMGPRLVAASIHAVAGAGAQLDAVAASFGPFMVPSARPVLHYVLDRPGAAERTLTLRATGYAWQVAGASERTINLQWTAADPIVRDPTVQTATALSGTAAGNGRPYPLVFNRTYPTTGGSPSTGTISSPGDVPVRPLVSIYGPVTGPVVTFTPTTGPVTKVAFVSSYRIDQGHYVLVDTVAKTAYLDGQLGQGVLAWLDWFNTTWPVLPIAPDSTTVGLAGSSTSNATQAVVTWQDGYLT
jgi:hypothetical protein